MADHATTTVQAADAAAAASTKALAATLGGGGAMLVGGMTANELAMITGAVVGVVGLAVQWYYRHQEYRMRRREHEARMAGQGLDDAS